MMKMQVKTKLVPTRTVRLGNTFEELRVIHLKQYSITFTDCEGEFAAVEIWAEIDPLTQTFYIWDGGEQQ